ERTCVIVAEQHRRYWRNTLWSVPSGNVIVQPDNRGTANGILLAVLRILENDPLARIVFLPADHYVREERILANILREAATHLTRNPRELLLVGIEPEEADPELGYIEPGTQLVDGTRAVARFIEKPDLALAHSLVREGAVWNSFIFAANGPALLGMLRERMPETVDAMATALARDMRAGARGRALIELYDSLPNVDFSREIVQGAEGALRVITAPACGWSDLGTPKRVAETLRRLDPAVPLVPAISAAPASINLAAQYARLQLTG
ncbi:MAG: sugar phosphate nucleotidyltransferase, partial [Steroidobacteraceae bacterium]